MSNFNRAGNLVLKYAVQRQSLINRLLDLASSIKHGMGAGKAVEILRSPLGAKLAAGVAGGAVGISLGKALQRIEDEEEAIREKERARILAAVNMLESLNAPVDYMTIDTIVRYEGWREELAKRTPESLLAAWNKFREETARTTDVPRQVSEARKSVGQALLDTLAAHGYIPDKEGRMRLSEAKPKGVAFPAPPPGMRIKAAEEHITSTSHIPMGEARSIEGMEVGGKIVVHPAKLTAPRYVAKPRYDLDALSRIQMERAAKGTSVTGLGAVRKRIGEIHEATRGGRETPLMKSVLSKTIDAAEHARIQKKLATKGFRSLTGVEKRTIGRLLTKRAKRWGLRFNEQAPTQQYAFERTKRAWRKAKRKVKGAWRTGTAWGRRLARRISSAARVATAQSMVTAPGVAWQETGRFLEREASARIPALSESHPRLAAIAAMGVRQAAVTSRRPTSVDPRFREYTTEELLVEASGLSGDLRKLLNDFASNKATQSGFESKLHNAITESERAGILNEKKKVDTTRGLLKEDILFTRNRLRDIRDELRSRGTRVPNDINAVYAEAISLAEVPPSPRRPVRPAPTLEKQLITELLGNRYYR